MSGNGSNHQAERNRRIYDAWHATHEAARLLGDRPKSLRDIARLFAPPGSKPLTRARIAQILQDEQRRERLKILAGATIPPG